MPVRSRSVAERPLTYGHATRTHCGSMVSRGTALVFLSGHYNPSIKGNARPIGQI